MINKKWIQIRKDLYLTLRHQVEFRLGHETRELRGYRDRCEREWNSRWTLSNKNDLLVALNSADIIYLADFHALQQSQKTHLRLLKMLPSRKKSFVLAMECIPHKYQKYLDLYCHKKISEKDFLKKIKWSEHWGFPWEHYRPIFKWAQEHHVPILGINEDPKKKRITLKKRDLFSAKKIVQKLEHLENTTMVVIYGDLHLAKKHLPQSVRMQAKKQYRSMTVFQNIESIYFKLLKKNEESLNAQESIVKMGFQTFCIFNVPPWVKWQNYLMYLGEKYDVELKEDGVDHTDHVAQYVKIISEDLGVRVSLNKISVYTASDNVFWDKGHSFFNKNRMKNVEMFIEEGLSFYIPDLHLAYLARPTVNHAAGLAMEYIHHELSHKNQYCFSFPRDFTRFIWMRSVAYFGSKIINHKRKTDTLVDLRSQLSSYSLPRPEREPLMLALSQKMNEKKHIIKEHGHISFKPRNKKSYIVAAQILGNLLGETLYNGYYQKRISRELLLVWISFPLTDEKFPLFYRSILENLDQVPETFQSKSDIL